MKKKSILYGALMLVSVVFTMCKKEAVKVAEIIPEPKPTADFNYKQVSVNDLKTFQFTSSSTDYKNLLWQFGDDSTSVLDSQQHTFRFFGKYKVVLTARNSEGYWAKKEMLLTLVNPAFDSTLIGENFTQTVKGTITVSKDNGGGATGNEGSLKMVDGTVDTKFLFEYNNTDGAWMKFELNEPRIAEAYSMVSADDAPSRDPKSWTFEASYNNLDWVVLDTRPGVLWTTKDGLTNRKTPRLYHFNNAVAYKYYRLVITENNGANLFQLAEWTINKSQP